MRFNQNTHKLTIDMDWLAYINAGQWLMIELFAWIDPNQYVDMLNNQFLKKYVTELFREQWGANLMKYENVELIGGVKLNGLAIYQEAKKNQEILMEELRTKWNEAAAWFIG